MLSALGDKKGRVADSSDLTRLQRESAVLAAYTTYTGLSVNKKARQQVGADRKFTLGRGGLTLISESTTGFTRNPITGAIVYPPYIPAPPQALVITEAVPFSQYIDLYFTFGSDGGIGVTDIYYSTDDGTTWASWASTSSPIIIQYISADGVTPLTNGTTYSIRIVAVNAAYPNPALNNLSEVIEVAPALPPDAPVITSATPGDASITIEFSLDSDGGSPVEYIFYSTDDGATWAVSGGTSSPFTITNLSDESGPLENGTEYFVVIVATTVPYPDPSLNTPSDPSPGVTPTA
jgi:hypothetical protein